METKLQGLYSKYGYTPFKMSKFEEYSFYSRNKGIIISEGVITFNDTNGKLMALKPDVTLSIVKNYRNETEGVQRLYYNENVYRISDKTNRYTEIHQMGLECLGSIRDYNICEVVGLAASSLGMMAPVGILNISNLDIIAAVLTGLQPGPWQGRLLDCIGEKNVHGVRELCRGNFIDSENQRLLEAITTAYGSCGQIAHRIKKITERKEIWDALDKLEEITASVESIDGVRICTDLSLVKDMEYYNGIIFQGFVEDVPMGVLSGGQYDCLMKKMEKNSGAIGFAIYLDPLERLRTEDVYDVDILLVYSPQDNQQQVLKMVRDLVEDGKTVSAQTSVPKRFSYGKKIEFGKE